MEEDVLKLKRKLLDAVDRNHNVRDAETVKEVLQVLENIEVDEELLRKTRLGKIVNDLRRNLKDEALARRAKQLIKRWRNYIVLRAGGVIAQGTQMGNGETDSGKNYVDVDRRDGKDMPHKSVTNGNPETSNYNSSISKEHYGCLGTSASATRSSSVQEQEPAAEVFENKIRNGSLNRFVEGKCKNLAGTIRSTKEMVVTMNPQDWNVKKLGADINKSRSEQKILSEQKTKIKMQHSGSAKTAQGSTNFMPRKKVKTTQELIKTVLSHSDLPQEGARNLRELHIGSHKSQGEHVKRTCELKLQPRETFVPPFAPRAEEHLVPLEDSNNERVTVDSFPECLSTAAQSTVNNESTVLQERDVAGKTEDVYQEETAKEVHREPVVSTLDLNVTDSNNVQCEEAVTARAHEDTDCNASFVKIEGVTGIFDEGPRRNQTDDGFREWHECLSKRGYNGELLAILPYVVID